MKSKIHPTYFSKSKTTCACGAVYDIGSTLEDIRVEICSNCHPFYTGNEKVLDSAGRVEKFKKRAEKAEATPAKKTPKKKVAKVAKEA